MKQPKNNERETLMSYFCREKMKIKPRDRVKISCNFSVLRILDGKINVQFCHRKNHVNTFKVRCRTFWMIDCRTSSDLPGIQPRSHGRGYRDKPMLKYSLKKSEGKINPESVVKNVDQPKPRVIMYDPIDSLQNGRGMDLLW